jgi:hypothetical protein
LFPADQRTRCPNLPRRNHGESAGRFEVEHPGDYATLNSYQPRDGTGYYPSGGIGLVLIIIVILLLMGRI